MRLIVILALSLFLSACIIEQSARSKGVMVAMPEMVTDCALVGEVVGNSKMTLVPQGEQLARYRALDEAAALGATHVVWLNNKNNISNYTVSAKAYYCDPDRVMPRSYKYIDQYLRSHRYPYDQSR